VQTDPEVIRAYLGTGDDDTTTTTTASAGDPATTEAAS